MCVHIYTGALVVGPYVKCQFYTTPSLKLPLLILNKEENVFAWSAGH